MRILYAASDSASPALVPATPVPSTSNTISDLPSLPAELAITRSRGWVLWEHAGMLDLPDYARKWKLKQAWYADNGILPHTEGGGPNGVLMWTDDQAGADAKAWLKFAAEILGVDEAAVATTGGGRSSGRRARKKAAPGGPK